jgi:hypothetical protein
MTTFASFWRHGSNTALLLAAVVLVGLFATRALAFGPILFGAVAIGALVVRALDQEVPSVASL